MQNQNTISDRVKYLRKTLKLTQKKLAQKLCISITSIGEIEQGKYKPNCDFLENISRVFNVNLYWLFFGEGKMFLDPAELAADQPGHSYARLEDIRNFLWYFQRSSIVQHNTLANFYSTLIKEKQCIEKEIREYLAKDEGQLNKQEGLQEKA